MWGDVSEADRGDGLRLGVDFVTGVVTAAMGKSKHSESGLLNSKAGWVGLAKKFCILLMVVVGVRIDILQPIFLSIIGIPLTLILNPNSGSGIGTNYIRDAVCISFCLNELLSIVENMSLMGVPFPPAMKKAIDVLQTKVGRAEEKIEEVNNNGNSET